MRPPCHNILPTPKRTPTHFHICLSFLHVLLPVSYACIFSAQCFTLDLHFPRALSTIYDPFFLNIHTASSPRRTDQRLTAIEDSYYIHLTRESLHTVWCFTLQLYWEGQYISANTGNKSYLWQINFDLPFHLRFTVLGKVFMGSVYQELRPLYFSNEISYHRHFQARPRSRTALPLKSCRCLKFLEFKNSIVYSWISKKIFAIQLDSQCLWGQVGKFGAA